MTMAIIRGNNELGLGGDGGVGVGVSVGVIGVSIGVLMLLFFLLLILLACRPWRFFRSRSSPLRISSIFKTGELERPLVSDHVDLGQGQTNESARIYDIEGSRLNAEEYLSSPRIEGLVHKQRVQPSLSHVQGDSVVLDVVPDLLDDAYIGQTLKRSCSTNHSKEEQKHGRKEEQGCLSPNLRFRPDGNRVQDHLPKDTGDQSNNSCSIGKMVDFPDLLDDAYLGQTLKRSYSTNQSKEEQKHGRKEEQGCLSPNLRFRPDGNRVQDHLPKDTGDQSAGSSLALEVISGPSRGIRYFVQSTDTSRLPLTLGRVSPSDLQLKDSEVSGKHAMINWNLKKLKWELVDMGSLNGTLLNDQPISHPDSGTRHWGDPIELATGDIITLGTTSSVFVQITPQTECRVPFGIGMASDPMAMRRGGKKLKMEDVCYYLWPLPGLDQFGVFGICDGHGGVEAAKAASKLIPQMVAAILLDSLNKEKVLSTCDASYVLREAFYRTEACMNHLYEGCTATVLLIWADCKSCFYVQCANLGDSACVMNVDGKLIKLTEDHRLTSYSERQRIREVGPPLRDEETRLAGLNLARMLGDKFVKQQDARFSAEPYVSQVVRIDCTSTAFAVMASDGLWDVISPKKAIQLILQTKERHYGDQVCSAEKIATFLLGEARNLRTKDNTSIIYLDFDGTTASSSSCNLGP